MAVKVVVRQEGDGAFFDLSGSVTIGLPKDHYKDLSLLKSEVQGVDGYFLHYHALRTVISNDEAVQLIALGVTVQ